MGRRRGERGLNKKRMFANLESEKRLDYLWDNGARFLRSPQEGEELRQISCLAGAVGGPRRAPLDADGVNPRSPLHVVSLGDNVYTRTLLERASSGAVFVTRTTQNVENSKSRRPSTRRRRLPSKTARDLQPGKSEFKTPQNPGGKDGFNTRQKQLELVNPVELYELGVYGRDADNRAAALSQMCVDGWIDEHRTDKEPEEVKPDFYGGIDGGTALAYFGAWFPDSVDDELRTECARKGVRPGLEWQETTNWNDFKERLDNLQALARFDLTKSKGRKVKPVFLEVGADRWQVMPTGMGSGVKCRWRLERGGVKIGIHQTPVANIPAVLVEFKYEALKFRPFLEVVKDVEEVLKKLGFVASRHTVSRVDLQLTIDLPFELVSQAFKEDRVISSFNRWAFHSFHDGQEHITESASAGLGSARKVQVCIYDKLRELFATPDGRAQKLNDLIAVMGERRHYTRVEFRLFRTWLRDIGINDTRQLMAALPEILHHLTTKTVRILEGKRVKGNESRQEVAEWWKDIQAKFLQAFNATYNGQELRRRRVDAYNVDRLLKMAGGFLVSALSRSGSVIKMQYDEFMRIAREWLRENGGELYEQYCDKFEARLVQMAPDIITDDVEPVEPMEIFQARADFEKRLQKNKRGVPLDRSNRDQVDRWQRIQDYLEAQLTARK